MQKINRMRIILQTDDNGHFSPQWQLTVGKLYQAKVSRTFWSMEKAEITLKLYLALSIKCADIMLMPIRRLVRSKIWFHLKQEP